MLGVPVVILTTIVGTSVFASLTSTPALYLQMLVGCISLVAAVLASLQTFLGYSEKSIRHANAATKYGALQKILEQSLVIPPETHEDLKVFFDKFRHDFEEQRKQSPTIPHDIWKAAKNIATVDESLEELVVLSRRNIE